jgi:L-serine dehydratase
MAISVFDLFRVGIGPSSSHTVGPMRAARTFASDLEAAGLLGAVEAVRAELFGSLAATARGHGSDRAVLLGLSGEVPEELEPARVQMVLEAIRATGRLRLATRREISFDEREHLGLDLRPLPFHPNAVRFTAFAAGGARLACRTFYSVGGGFVVEEGAQGEGASSAPEEPALPHRFRSGAELLALCRAHGVSISALALQNECALRPDDEVRRRLDRIWEVMQDCVRRGCTNEGVLPGGLGVKRRAPLIHRQLLAHPERGMSDPLTVLDWVSLYALAVNEENAAGGRVVTAPTNGAAGVVPAVLHYYRRFVPGASDAGVHRMLLAAGAIGAIVKENASISGAEVGCQGEVGSACSMAAAALTEALGGTPGQATNAAEIAMEHNLGLTCDPVRGLVQVPCIERNAMAAVKAIEAARLALRGEGEGIVSLDKVIWTMRETGRDMRAKYKETAQGGLALESPLPAFSVGLAEC